MQEITEVDGSDYRTGEILTHSLSEFRENQGGERTGRGTAVSWKVEGELRRTGALRDTGKLRRAGIMPVFEEKETGGVWDEKQEN